jgi:hypothetical protein
MFEFITRNKSLQLGREPNVQKADTQAPSPTMSFKE